MMESIAKIALENVEKISLVFVLGALLFIFGKIIHALLKSKDELHDKNNEIHKENAKSLVLINEKTIGGLDRLAVAIEKQSANSVELSTLIKFGMTKDK